ncbi:MAG: AEC family transporter [Synergistaceae bacterium]|nr:AEC family transporter [Synergistaceae bacterium]
MNLDFFVVMSNLVSLFVIIAVGYLAVKSGVLKLEASAVFSAFLLKITLPCTIFISLVQKDYDPSFIHDSMIIIAAGMVAYPAMLYVSRILAGPLGVPEGSRGVWAFTCAYNNCGFMGFPIALALLGAEGLALSVMLNITFNLTAYTIGAIEISRDNPSHEGGKMDIKGILFSGINVALVLSLIFYFGQIKLPEMIAAPINYISNITTPLSMVIIGMALARSHGLEVLTDKYAWLSAAMRLLVYPVIICLLLRVIPLGSNPMVGAVFILIMAMPAASVTPVLCEMYNGNMAFAAKIMFIQNVMCIVTIPLVCMLIG